MRLKLLACAAAVLCACPLWQAEAARPDSAFVGWRGESFDPQATFGGAAQVSSQGVTERWIETLSWSPRAFLYHGFLTEEEADSLIYQAAPHLKRSTVVGGKDRNVVDNIRTSYGTFLNRLSTPTVELVEKKLANWTQLPIIHQEDIQILRYSFGQKYGSHYDALGRICTVLIYLTEPEEGGETAFPKTVPEDWADASQLQYEANFSDCAKGHVAAKPKKGDALLFYSLKPDGKTTDSAAMHTGCPLLKGIKYTATIWMHPTPFRPEGFHSTYNALQKTGKYSGAVEGGEWDPGLCEDHEKKCPEWAASGECDNNPSYMKGEGSDVTGHCRRSCKVCEVCGDDDDECYTRNREAAGYLNLHSEVKGLTGRDLPLRRPAQV